LIGIENKIYEWTQEQKNQLKHYADFLCERSKNFCLLYLTPSGHQASDYSINGTEAEKLRKNNHLKEMSFQKDIIELFEEFELKCKADNVRAFLKDFNHYLRQQYKGEKVMDKKEFIKDYIMKNQNVIQYQDEIYQAIEEIKWDFIKSISEELEKNENYSVSSEPYKGSLIVDISEKKINNEITVRMRYDYKDPFIIGVLSIENKDDVIFEKLSALIASNSISSKTTKRGPNWAFYAQYEWHLILDNKKEIIELIDTIFNKLRLPL